MLGAADVSPHPSPTPISPFGPKQLLTRLSPESQQQTQQTALQSSVPKANKCSHTLLPYPRPWSVETERTTHSGNYHGPKASSTPVGVYVCGGLMSPYSRPCCLYPSDCGHGEGVVSLKLSRGLWASQMSATQASVKRNHFLETERGGKASYLQYFSVFHLRQDLAV